MPSNYYNNVPLVQWSSLICCKINPSISKEKSRRFYLASTFMAIKGNIERKVS